MAGRTFAIGREEWKRLPLPTLKQGDIVLAQIPDEEGKKIEWPHPAIILNKAADISPDKKIAVVAITSKFNHPLEKGEFLMPWRPENHPETGLWFKCIARCAWRPIIDYSVIIRRLGFTPRSILEEIAVEMAHQVKEKRERREPS
jgi:hypothetical protein